MHQYKVINTASKGMDAERRKRHPASATHLRIETHKRAVLLAAGQAMASSYFQPGNASTLSDKPAHVVPLSTTDEKENRFL